MNDMSTGGGQFDYSTDVVRLMDELKDWLGRPDSKPTLREENMVEAYSNLCSLCKDRCNRCNEFLRYDLLPTVAQYENVEPNLSDRFACLDRLTSLERDELTKRTEKYALKSVPGLLHDIYRELQDALADFEPLERWFAKYRQMVLKKSPLQSRLKVARKLMDSHGASFWKDDVVKLEQARIAEIRRDGRQAAKEGDVETLSRIEKELKSAEWIEIPSRKMVNTVAEWAKEAGSVRERRDLERIRQQLPGMTESIFADWNYWEPSFREMEVSELDADSNWQGLCRKLDEWWDAADRVQLNNQDPLYSRVEPVIEAHKSLADDVEEYKGNEKKGKAREKALGDLVESLRDPNVSRSTLEELCRRATWSGPLPPDIEAAYRKRMKSRLTTLGIGLFLALVIGAIVFAVVGGG
jgi:hypothetical protein